jgi:predicted acetyltransferase
MDRENVWLLEPDGSWKEAFLAQVADFERAGEQYAHFRRAKQDFEAFVDRLRQDAQGIGLPEGIVPMTSYWLVDSAGAMLGESRLRHYLSPALEVEGGHIGYAIRPSARRNGYGTHILALTLEKAQARGLKQVLVTCDTDNLGSARIIEKNGGVLAGHAVSPRSGKQISQYWIDT